MESSSGPEHLEQHDARMHSFAKALHAELDRLAFPPAPKRVNALMSVLDLSRAQTFRILSGTSLPSLEAMAQLRHLGVSFDEILDQVVGNQKPHVAVVDDDVTLLEVLAESLHSNFRVSTFNSVDSFAAELQRGHFDAFVLDWGLPGDQGDLVSMVRKRSPSPTPIYLLTGQAPGETVARLIREQDVIYGQKPVQPAILISTLNNALEKAAVTRAEPA